MIPILAVALVFSAAQAQALAYAYQVGGRDLAGIVYQESTGCARIRGKLDPRAIGCGQLHQETADAACGCATTRQALELNWRYNIRLAARILAACQAEFGEAGGITCYWLGAPAARTKTRFYLEHSPYLRQIRRRERELDDLPLSED